MDEQLTQAYADLFAKAQFLRRCNVRAFATPERGLVVDLVGGSTENWKSFWSAMEKVSMLTSTPLLPPRTPRVRLNEE